MRHAICFMTQTDDLLDNIIQRSRDVWNFSKQLKIHQYGNMAISNLSDPIWIYCIITFITNFPFSISLKWMYFVLCWYGNLFNFHSQSLNLFAKHIVCVPCNLSLFVTSTYNQCNEWVALLESASLFLAKSAWKST